MSTLTSKSRTFAVVLITGGQIEVHFLWRVKLAIETNLVHNRVLTSWSIADKDTLIYLLVNAGLAVRYFDQEERRWMEASSSEGLVPKEGPRDGQWGPPDLEQFTTDYLLA